MNDSSIPIPRTTQFNHKRLKASGFVEGAEPVTCTYTSATDATLSPTLRSESSFDEALNGSTTHVPDLGQFSIENHIDLGFNSRDENAVPETTCYSGDDLLQSFDPNCQDNLSEETIHEFRHSEEDTCSDESNGESGESDTESDVQYYTSDEEEASSADNDNVDIRLFSDHENACMAVLAYVSRHCLTTEAAKDLLDLVKVTCPESPTFKTLNYSKVQEVCGNCQLHVYDICEKCHRLFPSDDENIYNCETNGCVG